MEHVRVGKPIAGLGTRVQVEPSKPCGMVQRGAVAEHADSTGERPRCGRHRSETRDN